MIQKSLMKIAGDLAGSIWELVADGALGDGDAVIDGGRERSRATLP
jgi:hypothetical protein